jgi:threonine dehydrogenase-like Zn-dependent dehydrogenase
MARGDAPRVAVLGAGPIGLEAALYARKLGWPVAVYERGRIAEHVRRWGHVRLFSPFAHNSTHLGRTLLRVRKVDLPAGTEFITGKTWLSQYLEPLSQVPELEDCLFPETEVVQVGRAGGLKRDPLGDAKRSAAPFRLLLRTPNGQERIELADVVLDCTGVYGQHPGLGDGGLPALGERHAERHIAFGAVDVLGTAKHEFANKTILVVGSGYSAATTVCDLATLAEEQAATWVIWLARSNRSLPLTRVPHDPLRDRDRLALRANGLATRGDGNVEFHGGVSIEALEVLHNGPGVRVRGRWGGAPRVWEAERMIANVGGSPDGGLYRELHVAECPQTFAPVNLSQWLRTPGKPLTVAALATGESHYYLLGAKSYGRHPHFLLRVGYDQIRTVFAHLAHRADLDFYREFKPAA